MFTILQQKTQRHYGMIQAIKKKKVLLESLPFDMIILCGLILSSNSLFSQAKVNLKDHKLIAQETNAGSRCQIWLYFSLFFIGFERLQVAATHWSSAMDLRAPYLGNLTRQRHMLLLQTFKSETCGLFRNFLLLLILCLCMKCSKYTIDLAYVPFPLVLLLKDPDALQHSYTNSP